MENTNNKSFEQMAKEAEAKKRMQELAGITPTSKRTFLEVVDDMTAALDQIDTLLEAELLKNG